MSKCQQPERQKENSQRNGKVAPNILSASFFARLSGRKQQRRQKHQAVFRISIENQRSRQPVIHAAQRAAERHAKLKNGQIAAFGTALRQNAQTHLHHHKRNRQMRQSHPVRQKRQNIHRNERNNGGGTQQQKQI